MRLIIIVLFFFLFFMSFNNYNPQQGRVKIVLLKTKDWEELKKISIKGKDRIAVVDYKTRFNIVSTVQYQSESVEISKNQLKKLNKILKKYDR